MKKLNNKGVSFIELLICIAIMGFFMVAVVYFLSSGTRGVNTTTRRIKVQREAQNLYDSTVDMLQQAKQIVVIADTPGTADTYNYVSFGQYQKLLKADKDMTESTCKVFDDQEIAPKALVCYMEVDGSDYVTTFVYDQATKKLYVNKGTTIDTSKKKNNILTDKCKNFVVNTKTKQSLDKDGKVYKVSNHDSMYISIELNDGKYTYTADGDVKIRNQGVMK